MFEVIKLLFDICLFKKGPQDLPPSVWLLRLLIVIDVIVSFLMVSIRTDWLNSLLQAIVGALLIVGFSWLMLYVSRKRERFYQTSCAILGTDALISFFALPGMASMMIGRGAVLAFILTIALMIWHWAVTGHIFRNALGQTWTFSLGLAFLYILGSYQVMALLFPEVAGVK
ncbi:hypothetical protein [Methylobacter tundripaludum]|uniref:Yip1 domain-containing protein n=1 Tax=Methylobacter tundripaludum (strain ATCC BAA-1195 / DSM 17260 / SV96) TaxID=697282 RepID=G3IV48_METTV|nr:hypothetical protein [Methylobacter tundripaludum]EGW22844.1 hypothetical protein Mettu_1675 [Methylobacter tundripaludum SV96]